MSFVQKFFYGFKIPFLGLKTIQSSGPLKRLSLVPFIIGLLFVLIGFLLIIFYIPEFAAAFLTSTLNISAESKGYFFYPLLIITTLLFIILNVYLSYLATLIFAAPAYSAMAEEIFKKSFSNSQLKLSSGLFFKMLKTSIIKVLLFSVIGGSLILFSFFLPGFNIVASAFLFFVISSDSADYALEALGETLTGRLCFIKQNWVELAGLSVFVGVTLLIPGLLLLIMPAAVAGSSVFVFSKKAGRL